MVDSKEKGSRAEILVRDTLRKLTGLPFERTPLSGALDAKHGLKSDLYIPNEKNIYAIEVKHYKDDHVSSKILTDKTPQLLIFWLQACREAEQTNKKPLLVFKFDRSKLFVAFNSIPKETYRAVYIQLDNVYFYVSLLEDWIKHEQPKFIV